MTNDAMTSDAMDEPEVKKPLTGAWLQRLAVLVPYLWLTAFFLLPFLIVFKISLSQTAIAQPPYVPVFDLAAGLEGLKDVLRGAVVSRTTRSSPPTGSTSRPISRASRSPTFSTALLLLIGFPLAYGMARAPRAPAAVAVHAGGAAVLDLVPDPHLCLDQHPAARGLLNQVLLALGIVDAPPAWLATDTAVYIGLVYSYLPFMVLPIYATLEKMDETLLEAAADLGCPRWKAFWLVTLPLSLRA